jgi:hypothetical protein
LSGRPPEPQIGMEYSSVPGAKPRLRASIVEKDSSVRAAASDMKPCEMLSPIVNNFMPYPAYFNN